MKALFLFVECGLLSLETDPSKASRPFDRTRNGFVGTGGAVILSLGKESEALRRGATPMQNSLAGGKDQMGIMLRSPTRKGED